jgi:hypothetical protein
MKKKQIAMLKVLSVISLILLSFYKVQPTPYDLINVIIENYKEGSLMKEFYEPNRDRFNSYAAFSLASENDLVDPTKTFNLDSLFSPNQKMEIDQKAKESYPRDINFKKLKNPKILYDSQISRDLSNGIVYKISYPVIQKGINDKYYGMILERSFWSSGESGESYLVIYRLDEKCWTVIHRSLVSIT